LAVFARNSPQQDARAETFDGRVDEERNEDAASRYESDTFPSLQTKSCNISLASISFSFFQFRPSISHGRLTGGRAKAKQYHSAGAAQTASETAREMAES